VDKEIKQAIEYFYTKMEKGLIEDDKQQEVYEKAIDALNKQIPIKPRRFLRKIGLCKSYECLCGNCVFEYEQYCSYCGQRLDWNKEEK